MKPDPAAEKLPMANKARGSPCLQSPSVPDHELLRCIGRGSYGDVWLARNVLGEFRAVKVVYRDRFEHERPFEREFDGIRKFEPISRLHDSQVDILHVGRNDEAAYFYYVMELADDANVSVAAEVTRLTSSDSQVSTLNSQPSSQSLLTSAATYQPRTLKLDLNRCPRLPVDECLRIGLALCHALQHLHEHGLVHRDIKPSNIIFVGGVPKLADIGLVASMDQTMSFVGTSGFLPPEGPGTPQADIYSLGKVLYEISTGRDRTDFPKLPPELIQGGSSRREEAHSSKSAIHNPQSEKDQSLLTSAATRLLELNAVILKACHHDPRRRYQSAQEMAADLALLQRGRSVRRNQTLERRWTLARRVALSVALFTTLVASGWFLSKRFNASTPQPFNPTQAGINAIAVLPFDNDSPDQADEFLGTAVADELSSALTRIPGVRVLPRNSAVELKRASEIRSVARQHQLGALLTGRVRKSGGRLSITAQLVGTIDGFVLWSDTYEGEVSDLFALQTRLAESSARALRANLSDSVRARLAMRSTHNHQAHQLYLEGRFHWHKRSQESLKVALEKFQGAVALDPGYAQAHAGLADTLSIWEDFGLGPSHPAMTRARTAAQKAIALDDELAEAHAALGKVLMLYDWDWLGAEREYRRAIQLDPNYATARQGYAQCLDAMRREPEALKQIQTAVELDPLAPIMHVNLVIRLYYQRRFQEALECFRRARELHPKFGNYYFGRLFEDTQQYDLAVEEWSRAWRHSGAASEEEITGLQAAYATSGIQGFWRKRLELAEKQAAKGQFVPARYLAELYARLGEREHALDLLEKVFEERSSSSIFIHREPAFAPLSSHPRFSALVRKLGLEKWPPPMRDVQGSNSAR